MSQPAATPDDALLSYTLDCTPNPLRVSTEQESQVGQLTLEVGLPLEADAGLGPAIPAATGWDSGPEGTGGGILNSGGTVSVWCRWFEVVIPIGDKDTDLANIPLDTSALQAITIYAPGQWQYTARLFQAPAGQWNAGIRFTAIDRYGDEAPYVFNGTNPVNVTIGNIPINAVPGFPVIPVTEYTSQTSGTTGYAERQALREAQKADKEFYFYDLHPTRPYVALGQVPTLQWKGNVSNSAFTVYWYDGTGYQEAAVPGQSWQCPKDHLPKNTTTFMVVATHVPPGQSKAIVVHLTTTVTVTNPVIEATSITSNGDVTIIGGNTLKTDKIARAGATAPGVTFGSNVYAIGINATGDINTTATLRANTIGRSSGQGDIIVNDTLKLLWGLKATSADSFIEARQITSDTSITASGDVTIHGGGTLRTDKIAKATPTVSAITVTDDISAAAITASGDVTSEATLRGNTIGRVSGQGDITVNDTLNLLWGLNATTDNGKITAQQLTSFGDIVAHGTVKAFIIGIPTGQGSITITDDVTLNYGLSATTARGIIRARHFITEAEIAAEEPPGD